MQVSSTNSPLLSRFSPEEAVELMYKAGFDAIDFSFHANACFYNEESDSPAFKERLLNLRSMAEAKGMRFNQAHAPFASSFKDEEQTARRFRDIVRTLRSASYLGIPNVVVHPMQHLNYADRGVPEQLFQLNMDFYNRLLPYCEAYGVKVAVENMWQRPAGMKISHSTCSRPEEFIRYLDNLDRRWFTGCLDIGHACLVCENPADFIRALGKDRLTTLHVHDVDGMDDLHTMPYYGIINWDEVMAALKEIDYQGDFTFEVGKTIFSSLPNELLPAALRLLADTGHHLVGKV